MQCFVHGLFKNERNASSAVQCLVDAHFEPNAISALMRVEHDVNEANTEFKTGVGAGAALGGTFGAIGGAVGALGGFFVAGPLLAAIAGGAAGYLVGALAGLGRWKDELEFSPETDASMILVGVSTDAGNIDRARDALAAAGPERVHVSQKNEACEELETGTLSDTGILMARR